MSRTSTRNSIRTSREQPVAHERRRRRRRDFGSVCSPGAPTVVTADDSMGPPESLEGANAAALRLTTVRVRPYLPSFPAERPPRRDASPLSTSRLAGSGDAIAVRRRVRPRLSHPPTGSRLARRLGMHVAGLRRGNRGTPGATRSAASADPNCRPGSGPPTCHCVTKDEGLAN